MTIFALEDAPVAGAAISSTPLPFHAMYPPTLQLQPQPQRLPLIALTQAIIILLIILIIQLIVPLIILLIILRVGVGKHYEKVGAISIIRRVSAFRLAQRAAWLVITSLLNVWCVINSTIKQRMVPVLWKSPSVYSPSFTLCLILSSSLGRSASTC